MTEEIAALLGRDLTGDELWDQGLAELACGLDDLFVAHVTANRRVTTPDP
jgi:hypothetical protein